MSSVPFVHNLKETSINIESVDKRRQLTLNKEDTHQF